ncbi:MAG: mevalonate kinase [Bradymonadia bacterium]|jgi:mevalonate kinase
MAIERLVEALPCQGGAVEFTSTVPPGAGLGSSASMAVAVARALAELHGVTLSDSQLSDAALASERVFHGNPSGLDHAVAIRGGLIAFSKAIDPPSIRTVQTPRSFRLLIAKVSPGADTGKMVAGVAAQRERLGDVAIGLHEQIHSVAIAGMEALGRGDSAALGELMNINHGLLSSIGVSTAELDAACHLARNNGALGAKLTGAGGGGCIIALVNDDDNSVEPAFIEAGHTVYSTTIGKK